MVKHLLLAAAVMLLWSSLLVIACGNYLMVRSPQWEEYRRRYEKAAIAEMPRDEPGHDYGPGLGVGLALAGSWEFRTACQVVITLFVTGAVLCSCLLLRNYPFPGIVVSGLTGCVFLWMITGVAHEAAENFTWGFIPLAVGEVMWAIAVGTLTALLAAKCWCVLRSRRGRQAHFRS